ncbi:MAG TPA: magnesium transporter CorA family protein [Hyphomicrobiaceae bacterium]|jgi:magnesium transporter|nr:magnesium transporter CorA family protein [Hyphomicrobiaceae bacterium]
MLTIYDAVDGALIKRDGEPSVTPATVWIDLQKPSKDEDLLVEQALGILVPTREEMAEIEASSRVYQEGGAHVMTAIVLHQSEGLETLTATPVTFILAGNRLVTVRYAEPRAFQIFVNRAQKKDAPCISGIAILTGLLEAIIDREADRVERIQGEVDKLSQMIFGIKGGERTRSRRFDVNIRTIGREGELTSRSRESLLTLDRVLTYLTHVMSERGDDKPLRARVKTAHRDVQSLADHIGYLSTKITFLLDATLGMISNEQNTIIKIFSVLAVILLPPTLVGTIYGMNFKHMPELEWTYGYPLALGLMVAAGVLPWLYFRRKGWL